MSAAVRDGKESGVVVEEFVERRLAGDRGEGRRTAKDHGRCDAGLGEAINGQYGHHGSWEGWDSPCR